MPQSDSKGRLTDKALTCAECKKDFVFSAGEQRFYAKKSLQNTPKRCQGCRQKRKPLQPRPDQDPPYIRKRKPIQEGGIVEMIRAGMAFVATGPDRYIHYQMQKNQDLIVGSHVLVSRSTDGKVTAVTETEEGEDVVEPSFPTLAAVVRSVNLATRVIGLKTLF